MSRHQRRHQPGPTMRGLMASPAPFPEPVPSLRAVPPLESDPPDTGDGLIKGVPVKEAVEDFRAAWISRLLDDREIALQKQSRVYFQISGAGHEALLLGLGRELRAGHDWFFPYYRDRALMLSLGESPRDILLQAVGSAEDPSSAGRQMPCHFGMAGLHVVTQSSPTGTQCLPAVGCAEATRYLAGRDALPGCSVGEEEITYVSLGEGATSEGEFWEALNTACTLSLPVLFLVADNGWAISVPVEEQAPAPISELVSGFPGLAVHRLDGLDYFEVRRRAPAIVEAVRSGSGPALVHARVTRPYSHSSADTQSKYRSAEELAVEAASDPLVQFEAVLLEAGVLDQPAVDAIREEARLIVLEAARSALAAPRPDPVTVTDHVIDLPRIPDSAELSDAELEEGGGETVAMGEAIRRTLAERMAVDERIRVFGEDVADARDSVLGEVAGKGGVFGTTHGLQRSFGTDRCFNTPLAEANIVGRAVGQGLRGLRPVPEIQFFDYIWPAMQQIKSEAATIRWRSAGSFTCPMVLRAAIGGYLTGGAIWHSQSGESIFTHVPGLAVVMPSRASDAAGLLRSALDAEDPVLFLEHKHLLRQPYTRTPFPAADHRVPFGKGRVARGGSDLVIVTWGALVEKSRQAAEDLAGERLSVAVIDLRSLAPWDHELVADWVAKTGRVLVAHEDSLVSGFGAEVAAWVGEHCFADLDAPVYRLGATDTPVAYEPTLEREILPQTDDVLVAARRVLDY
jgi:2-oxoisovalerate dehydrogenase E1 component